MATFNTYQNTTRFVFYSKSADKPPGKGVHEYIDDPSKYLRLAQIPDWRKVLSNFWTTNGPLFQLDGKKWASVEHYFQAVKFRHIGVIDRYNNLAWDGIWGKIPPSEAKSRGGKSRTKGYRLTPEQLTKWDEVKSQYMLKALEAKFIQDYLSNRVLKYTYPAELKHLMIERGKKSHLDKFLSELIMEVRYQLIITDKSSTLKSIPMKPPATEPTENFDYSIDLNLLQQSTVRGGYKLIELKDFARQLGLKISGTKAELVARISAKIEK